MTTPTLTADRTSAAATVGIAAAAWVGLAVLAVTGAHAHIGHDAVLGSHHHGPSWLAVGALLGMWSLMVLAMMPPATPLLTGAQPAGRTLAATIGANLAVWVSFALVALAGDAVIHLLAETGALSASTEGAIPAIVLTAAGFYQLSPAKRRFLAAARSATGPLHHSVCCLGSCWALMLLTFALGMGSLALMAALTIVMCLEQWARRGELVAALTGIGLVASALLTTAG